MADETVGKSFFEVFIQGFGPILYETINGAVWRSCTLFEVNGKIIVFVFW